MTGARHVFAADVVPILERSCAATTCHGVAPDAELRGEVIDASSLKYPVGGNGEILNIDAARAETRRMINTDEDARFSPLLRKPLDVAFGGSPHFAPTQFETDQDAEFRTIEAWIQMETGGGVHTEPLTALQRQFADEVQPELVSLGCMLASCHGPANGVPYKLDPGVQGHFSRELTQANYLATKAMISLDADPLQSRVVGKILPLSDGGTLHRGGSPITATDPRLAPLLDWICAEQDAEMGRDCDADSRVEGIVFVRGFVGPEHPFALDVWTPGTDLFLAEMGDAGLATGERNLTAHLHDGPADIRDPAVDPSGERVVFAMRLGPETGHELWEMDLEGGAARRVTFDGSWRDPTWGPDGHIWAVSTLTGVEADGGERLDGELYEIDPTSGQAQRRSFTPHIERKPVFFSTGSVAGEVSFSVLRDVAQSRSRAHIFSFPPDLRTEYHQHFGSTPAEDLFFDMRQRHDGTFVTVIGTLDNRWGGRLGIVDRDLGPLIPMSSRWQEPGLPNYITPLSRLDDFANPGGPTGAIWRDPVALPDGRLLAARALGPANHADTQLQPDFSIQLVTVEPDPRGDAYRMVHTETAIDAPGLADYDPEPVYRRWLPQPREDQWDPDAETAVLRHHGYDIIDALLGNLPPAGPKEATPEVVAVRLVEAVDQRSARILGEIPLAADGSFAVEVPAQISIRIQGIDRRGLAVGAPTDRWIDFHPGQQIDLGVQPEHYSGRCAPCHGALDGDPEHVHEPPDLLSSASVTLSTHALRDRRRPLDPIPLGEATRVNVDFALDVLPILEDACVACHSGDDPAGHLLLDTGPYDSLLRRGPGSKNDMAYVDRPDASARGSFLAEKLLGEELDAPRDLTAVGVPHPSGPGALSDDEIRTLLQWMDLGASEVGVR